MLIDTDLELVVVLRWVLGIDDLSPGNSLMWLSGNLDSLLPCRMTLLRCHGIVRRWSILSLMHMLNNCSLEGIRWGSKGSGDLPRGLVTPELVVELHARELEVEVEVEEDDATDDRPIPVPLVLRR